jgi:hypothetical protein
VDDEDYPLLSGYKWMALYEPRGYTYAVCRMPQHGRRLIRLHRFLLGIHETTFPFVDHKDGDGLNNQRSNIRECSRRENRLNARKRFVRSQHGSLFKGVLWLPPAKEGWTGRWQARLGKTALLGKIYARSFPTEVAAALGYNAAAFAAFGEFARLNEIVICSDPQIIVS